MYCPNCKQSFDSKFCPECGTKLIEDPIAEQTTQNADAKFFVTTSNGEEELDLIFIESFIKYGLIDADTPIRKRRNAPIQKAAEIPEIANLLGINKKAVEFSKKDTETIPENRSNIATDEEDADVIDNDYVTIKNGKLTFKKGYYGPENDDLPEELSEIKNMTQDIREIDFSNCFESLDNGIFNEMDFHNVIKLDFSKAFDIEFIDSYVFQEFDSLKVVVLPPNVTSLPTFNDCQDLLEIHINKVKMLRGLTWDEDNRITLYISSVSDDLESTIGGMMNSTSKGSVQVFFNDVRKIYVPKDEIGRFEQIIKKYDEYENNIEVLALPNGYSFPKTALAEPWHSAVAKN